MKQGEKTKQHILKASNKLFYTHGYNHTSFSDIVNATGLSKGNITYHFKTKQGILEGIIANRLHDIKTSLKKWELANNTPKERLISFCKMIEGEASHISAFGCPMGTLSAELAKNEPKLHAIVLPMFETYRDWLTKQYTLASDPNAKASAMSLLACVQGVAMMAHAFSDEDFLHTEMGKIKKTLLFHLQNIEKP